MRTRRGRSTRRSTWRSEEHTSELQSRQYLVCRLLLEKKKKDARAIRQQKKKETPEKTEPQDVRRLLPDRLHDQLSAQAERVAAFACHFLFFFNDTATTEIYTLSLHDALPISAELREWSDPQATQWATTLGPLESA